MTRPVRSVLYFIVGLLFGLGVVRILQPLILRVLDPLVFYLIVHKYLGW